MKVHRANHRAKKNEKFHVRMGLFLRIEQVHTRIRRHRPVIVLARAVQLGERFFVEDGLQSVARCDALQRFHHDHLVIARDIIFNGDNYSEQWQSETEKRGLPNLKNSVEATPVLSSEKSVALFGKYKVLTKAEIDSRVHAAMEKYAKQLQIESEAMVLMARQLILPAYSVNHPSNG